MIMSPHILNPEYSDGSSLEERFRLVHDHLDLIDCMLNELALELHDEIESAPLLARVRFRS